MFICIFCKIFKIIFWQNTSGWLLLVFIYEFWEIVQITFFIEHLWETAYLCTSCRISTTRYRKKVFHKRFSSILYKNRKQLFESVHLLKIPEIISKEVKSIIKLRDTNLQVNEKRHLAKMHHSHILVHVFCLHFFRMHHNYFFWRGFENVRVLFFSGNKAKSSVNLPVQWRFF